MKNSPKKRATTSNDNEKMTPYMESWLAEVEEDRKTGKNFSGPFDSADELIKHPNNRNS